MDILTPGGQIPNRFDAQGIYRGQAGNTLGQQELGHAAAFVQYSVRAARGLTADAGLRWGGQFNETPETGNDILLRRVRGGEYPFGRLAPGSLPDDLRQWEPTAGFAFAPGGMSRPLVVRGSFGLFHAATPPVFFNAATNAFRDPPFNVTVTLPTKQPTVYQQFLAAGIDLNHYSLGDLPVFSKQDVERVLDGGTYLGASPITVSPQFTNPVSRKYSLAVEWQPAARSVLGVQWLRQVTRRLHGMRDYNLPPSVVDPGDPALVPTYEVGNRPVPELGAVQVVESIARANYDGVTFSWKYGSDRLQLAAHYTYSRSYSSDINAEYFCAPRYTDPEFPDRAYGPSDLDMRHQVTGHSVLGLPGGVTLSAILRLLSAPPLDPTSGTDLNGDLVANDRGMDGPGRFLGRNSFRNRPMRSVDMRLLKGFSLSETARLELSAEAFNCLDFDNVEFGGFNSIYGTGVDLSTGSRIGPRASFRRLRGGDGSYDRNNRQVPGVSPLQVQVGARIRF